MVILRVENLTCSFNGHPVLDNLNLTVKKGEIVGIIGPNGAGKSTFFNVLTGMIHTFRGRIFFRDREVTGWPTHRICRLGIGRTFQGCRPFKEKTVLENVLVGYVMAKSTLPAVSDILEKAHELLELVELSHKSTFTAGDLTLSEQRRLELARILATEPKMLLLDEIAAGMSPIAIEKIIYLLKKVHTQSCTILIIDHFLNFIGKLSNHLIALAEGKKIAEGTSEEVLSLPSVKRAYVG